MIGLWRYNKATGYWKLERQCDDDTARQWLSIFQKDAPNEKFKLSKTKPRDFDRQLPPVRDRATDMEWKPGDKAMFNDKPVEITEVLPNGEVRVRDVGKRGGFQPTLKASWLTPYTKPSKHQAAPLDELQVGLKNLAVNKKIERRRGFDGAEAKGEEFDTAKEWEKEFYSLLRKAQDVHGRVTQADYDKLKYLQSEFGAAYVRVPTEARKELANPAELSRSLRNVDILKGKAKWKARDRLHRALDRALNRSKAKDAVNRAEGTHSYKNDVGAKDAIQHIAVEPTPGGYRVRAQHGEANVTRGGFTSPKKAEKFGQQMMRKMGEQASAPPRYGLGWKIQQQNLQEPPAIGSTIYFADPMTGKLSSGKMLGVGSKPYLFRVERKGEELMVPRLALRNGPVEDATGRAKDVKRHSRAKDAQPNPQMLAIPHKYEPTKDGKCAVCGGRGPGGAAHNMWREKHGTKDAGRRAAAHRALDRLLSRTKDAVSDSDITTAGRELREAQQSGDKARIAAAQKRYRELRDQQEREENERYINKRSAERRGTEKEWRAVGLRR